MQRAQRGVDNHAVDLAVEIANLLRLPLVVYFAGISNFPHANLRHYVFLNQGLKDIEADLASRNISFVMRRAPHESHERLLADVQAAHSWSATRILCASPNAGAGISPRGLKFPSGRSMPMSSFPSKLMEKAQYGAYTIRPRLYRLLPEYLHPYGNPHAEFAWKKPRRIPLGLSP